jgi:hypothetical protein
MDTLRMALGKHIVVAAVCVLACLGNTAWSQNYLYGRANFLTGNFPAGVTVADFNGDGKLDLAVSNFSDNTVSILLGVRAGTFGAAVSYATGMSPAALASGDFNHDGKLDLAVANENDHTLSILLGNGDGTFQPHTDYAAGYYPIAVIAADFNGDQQADIAVLDLYDSTVSVFINNGDGTFQPQTLITVGSTPTAMASADFNGDGKIDLITTNIGTGTVSVLLSNGDGTFARTDTASGLFPGSNTSEVAVGDFNSDGEQDAVVSSANTFQLFFLAGNGAGGFTKAVSIPNPPQLPASYYFITAGDFNRDGKLDLALAGLFIMPGRGDGTFGKPIESPSGGAQSVLASADLNGDGLPDFAGVDSNLGSVDILLGNGKGIFQSLTTLSLVATDYGPLAGAVGDFNGDGKLDLAVAEINFPNGLVAVSAGNGDGTFQRAVSSPLGISGGTNVMLSGDFNGDGKTDLLLLDTYSGGIETLLGNGDNSFQTPVDTPSLAATALGVGDLNADGKSDLVAVANQASGLSVVIYLSNGDGTFSQGSSYGIGSGGVTVCDVNHDGLLDLVATGSSSQLLVFLGKGDGTFGTPIQGPTVEFTQVPVGLDFDGDGSLDLVGGTGSGIAFLKGNGRGSFRAPIYSNTSYPFVGNLVAADISGDGKLDLVTAAPQSTTLGGIVAMVGNGNGTFGGLISLGASGIPVGWPAGDFNSDGVADIAIPNQSLLGNPVVSLYLSAPTINLFPSGLRFGGVAVGKTSKAKTVILTNTGNAPLVLSTIMASGDFQQSNQCGTVLAIEKSCTLQVVFKPTAKGERTGVVSFSDNAAASPQKVHLSGTGQ